MTLRIRALQTGQTTPARARDPFDAHAIPNLDGAILGRGSHFDNGPDAFVAADLALLGRVGKTGPGIFHDAEVAVADAAVGPIVSPPGAGKLPSKERRKLHGFLFLARASRKDMMERNLFTEEKKRESVRTDVSTPRQRPGRASRVFPRW